MLHDKGLELARLAHAAAGVLETSAQRGARQGFLPRPTTFLSSMLTGARNAHKICGVDIPAEFLCPITHEVLAMT